MRSCFRSQWRLHDDPAILTPGRYYFAPPGTPTCPVPTLLGSRDYTTANRWGDTKQGEWAGKRKWDNGAPPIFLPDNVLVGGEPCISDGATGKETDPVGPSSFRTVCIGGRDHRFPTLTYVSFSVGRHDRDFTYYNDVELTLVDAMCEARYEGPSGIPNVTAVLRVTDVPDGSLATNFYLADTGTPPPPPIPTDCCENPVAASWVRSYRIYGSSTRPAFTEVWSVLFENITQTWQEELDPPYNGLGIGSAWAAYVNCAGENTTAADSTYVIWTVCSHPGGDHWHTTINRKSDLELVATIYGVTGEEQCDPVRVNIPLRELTNYVTMFCGHIWDPGVGPWAFVEVESPEP